jgi:hypothetical protein
MRVHREFDPAVDFSRYATFGWLPRPASTSAEPLSPLDSELGQRRMRAAVERALVGKGLTRADTPDLLVAVHRTIQDRVEVTDWGYGDPGYDWEGRDVEAYTYRQGTLILDLVDAGTKELVWRGSATTTLDETAVSSPGELEREMNEVVARILETFPPEGDAD